MLRGETESRDLDGGGSEWDLARMGAVLLLATYDATTSRGFSVSGLQNMRNVLL
jgi:hypothetical protein